MSEDLHRMSNTRLASFFQDRDILSPDEWARYESEAAESATDVVQHLVVNSVVPKELGYEAIAFERRWKYQSLRNIDIEPEVIDVITADQARELKIIPISMTADGEVTFATFNPDDIDVDKQLRSLLGRKSNRVFSPPEELDEAIGDYYSDQAQAIKTGTAAAQHVDATAQTIDVRDASEDGVINQLLKTILDGAISMGSTSVHIEPTESNLSIRYGFGRKLRDQPHQQKAVAERIINLIKTKSKLNPSELLDQNGTMVHKYRGKNLDIRVAILPSVWGESITLRIAVDTFRDISDVGFSDYDYERWMTGLENPGGLVALCGPMNSGKTTTIMASVKHFMKDRSKKIISLEDPVEVKIPAGITQVSINKDQQLTWERVLGTSLRSTASVLFLGEVNQDEIAHIALQAASTGHLVLTTLHTNDAPGVVLRLREMGIKPSVIAENMRTVCAQRLPDRLCDCKVLTTPTARQIRDFNLSEYDVNNIDWYGPGGKIRDENKPQERWEDCHLCMGTGYRGSVPIHEIMTFPEEIRELIINSEPTYKLREAARRHGMRTLQEDGLEKVKLGLTSLQELRSQLLID